MRFLDALRPEQSVRRTGGLSQQAVLDLFAQQQFLGSTMPSYLMTYGANPAEPIANNFAAFVQAGLQGNSVVWALESKRLEVFSQVRFQYQQMRDGRPGNLFGNPDLDILERPWPGGTTGDMLGRMIIDADFAGNSWQAPLDGEIVRLRPDYVEIILEPRMLPLGGDGEDVQVGWRQIGIMYYEGGLHSGAKPAVFLPGEYAHFAPKPDPLATYRGMSWLTPVIRELQADTQATKHKLKFFENAATPNLAVSLPKEITPAQFEAFVDAMDAKHKGAEQAYKTLYTGGGADVTVIGANMQQLDFKVTQGAGETRLAAAAGVHPVVAGLSEGMQGSSLNAGNFGSAKRLFVDTTCRYLWQNAAGSLAPLVPELPGARLWYDARDVPFLFEDQKDIAQIQQMQASAWRQLVDGGMDPDAATAFIQTNDLTALFKQHSGLYSVQLQPPTTDQQAPANLAAPTVGGGGPKGPAASAARSSADGPVRPRRVRRRIRRADGDNAVAVDWDDDPIGDLDEPTEALIYALFRYAPKATRALTGAAFNAKHKRGPNGRFIKMVDRIIAALDDHKKNGGKGDPFAGFDREQLRKAAKSRGIALVRNEDRDSIAAKLIADLTPAKASTAKKTPAAKPAAAPKAPPAGTATAQRPSLNQAAMQDAKDVANRVSSVPRAHTASVQLSTYSRLTKADFDGLDTATRTWIMADLGTIKASSRGPNGTKADGLLHRFSPAGTAAGTVPAAPVIPPKAAKTAKTAVPDPDGTPGLLKKAKNQGTSGDGWYYPSGGGKPVWGKFGAAGLLLRHRGPDGVDRFLMVQRGPGISDPGKWQFPGGAIDSKETPYEGATREVLEELGFKDADLADGRVHGTHEASVDSGGWKYTSIAATVPTQIKPNLTTHHARMETSDAKWMTIDEIRQLDKGGKLLTPLAGGKLEQNVVSLFPPSKGGKPARPKTPPLPTHKPSKGRDLVSDKTAIDKLRQDVKKARSQYAGKVADDRLAAIGAMQGYDDTPTVATRAQVDKLLATGDYIEVWRGVRGQGWGGKTAADIHEDMRSGTAYYGHGIFGNGYYLATDKAVAEQYSDKTPGSVMRALIPKSAVIADHTKITAEARSVASPRSKAKGRRGEDGTLYDEGRYAAAKGVDGIEIPVRSRQSKGYGNASHVAKPGKPAYNWLNRSVLIIQEG